MVSPREHVPAPVSSPVLCMWHSRGMVSGISGSWSRCHDVRMSLSHDVSMGSVREPSPGQTTPHSTTSAQPWCHQPGQDTQTHDSRHQTVNVWNSSAENLSKFYFITQCVWVDKLRCIVDCTGFTDKIFLNIYAIFTCSSVYFIYILFISTISTPIHSLF